MNEHHRADSPLDELRFHRSEISDRIRGLVRAVDRDNATIGVSTREQRAVALGLDRPDLAKRVYGTLLECAIRVGPESLAASAYVQANGWTAEAELDHA